MAVKNGLLYGPQTITNLFQASWYNGTVSSTTHLRVKFSDNFKNIHKKPFHKITFLKKKCQRASLIQTVGIGEKYLNWYGQNFLRSLYNQPSGPNAINLFSSVIYEFS